MDNPNLKTSTGQIISGSDPNYETYKKQGATAVSDAPAVVTTDDLKSNTSDIKGVANKQQSDLIGVQNALKDTSIYNKKATSGFINAAFQARYGRDANEGELGTKTEENPYGLEGATVKDVVGRLGLDRYLQDYGLGGEPDPTETSSGGNGTGDTGGNTDGGDSGGETSTGNPILDQLYTWYKSDSDMVSKLTGDLETEQDAVSEKSQVANTLKADLDQLRNDLDYDKVLQTIGTAEIKKQYYNDADEIRKAPVLASTVNARLSKLTTNTNIALDKKGLAEAVTNATNTYRYNSKLIEYNVALGDLQSAQAIAKQTAQDIKDYKSEMLNIMSIQNQITMQDKQLKQDEIDREFGMIESGYTPVANIESLNQLAIDKGLDWVKSNTINLGGKIYIKPAEGSTSDINDYQKSQLITSFMGQGYDFATAMQKANQVILGVGFMNGSFATGLETEAPDSTGGYDGGAWLSNDQAPAQGFRTDRHNNPTAFTTDIASQAGLVLGVDYEIGDAFPGNESMHTARLLGDPVEQTIKVIDDIGFYTQSGQQRWSHTAMPEEMWHAMSYDQKRDVIKLMNQREGGSGVLFGEDKIKSANNNVEGEKTYDDFFDMYKGEGFTDSVANEKAQSAWDEYQSKMQEIEEKEKETQDSVDRKKKVEKIAKEMMDAFNDFGSGANWATGVSSMLNFLPGTPGANFKAKFKTLRETMALDNIDKLKGSMSDKDIEFLRSSASPITLSMTEGEFLKTLKNIYAWSRGEEYIPDDDAYQLYIDTINNTSNSTSSIINK